MSSPVLFQDGFDCSGQMNLRISLSISVKKAAEILLRDCIQSVDHFEKYCPLNSKSSNSWTSDLFHLIEF